MNKIQKLGLVLKYLQIAYALTRFAEKLHVFWNMINNYILHNGPKMVFEVRIETGKMGIYSFCGFSAGRQ